MNPKLDFIFARRSVRKFQEGEIQEEILNDLLKAAMAAPSAVGRDPWHFIVVRNKSILERITDILPNGKMLREAGAGIIVCGDIERAHDRRESYMLQDLSAATENILLAARALGLGSCWLGIHPRQERIGEIRKLFSLPENIIPMCGIALGWPAEEPEPRTRYQEERVHWEGWTG
ncbi:MAG: nitroreductase family protein [Desulfurivibrionaceae bacterium]